MYRNKIAVLLAVLAGVSFSFQPDTTIQAGDLSVEVAIKVTEVQGKKVCWYTDALGRVVQFHSQSGGSKGSVTQSKGLYLTEQNNVLYSYNTYKSTGPGFVRQTIDTLWGETWNRKGMITMGTFDTWKRDGGKFTDSSYSVNITYDSTEIKAIQIAIDSSSITFFKVDHYYTDGDITHPVMQVDHDSLPEDAIYWVDTLGRPLHKKYGNGGPKGSWSVEQNLLVNSENKVAFSLYEHRKASLGQSYSLLDSLTGLDWNEKGMITEGILHRIVKENGNVTDTIMNVTIIYDSSGVHPITTLTGKETSLLTELSANLRLANISYRNNQFTIIGTSAHSIIEIVDVRGRLIINESVSLGEEAKLSTEKLSSGTYVLKINNKSMLFTR